MEAEEIEYEMRKVVKNIIGSTRDDKCRFVTEI